MPVMPSSGSVTLTNIPDGWHVYYEENVGVSSTSPELFVGQTVELSGTSLFLIFYPSAAASFSPKYGVNFGLYGELPSIRYIAAWNNGATVELNGVEEAISVGFQLITETTAGTDITIGSTTFEGVTGVKYNDVNYIDVVVDGVTYDLSQTSSAPVDMCTVDILVSAPVASDFTVYYSDGNLEVNNTVVDSAGGTLTVAKGTILTIAPWANTSVNTGCTTINTSYNLGAFVITDDATLSYQ